MRWIGFQQIPPQNKFLMLVRKHKLQYFGRVIRAQNLWDKVKTQEEGKEGNGQMKSKQWTRISLAECT